MNNYEFVKIVYLSKMEDPDIRDRPLGKLEDRIGEYMCETGTSKEELLEQGNRMSG